MTTDESTAGRAFLRPTWLRLMAVAGLCVGASLAVPAANAAGEHDHHNMYEGCSDDDQATIDIVAQVEFVLAEIYTDVPTLVAKGYHPYFDAIPGGFPPGGGGVQHYIRPQYIDDGVNIDPFRPESILLDEWNRPIGLMFIADSWLDEEPVVYTNPEGVDCTPWHRHTDDPARFGWMWYRAVYDGTATDGTMEYPDETPPMMHIWGIPNSNDGGRYTAMDYPPAEGREGAPGPIPSYFDDTTIQDAIYEAADQVPAG